MNKAVSTALQKAKQSMSPCRILDFLWSYYEYVDQFAHEKVDSALKSNEANPNYPDALLLPLSERKSGILNAMEWFAENDTDFNIENDLVTPLTIAISYSDWAMVEFLILHGADANHWHGSSINEPSDNFYMEELDLHWLNSTWQHSNTFAKAILKCAEILLTIGNVANFQGLCLQADQDTHEIELTNLQLKY